MNLTLSKRGDYVVRAAICLASNYDSGLPTKRHQVSSEMGIPRTFVSQILGNLVQAKLAVSSSGKDGGYRLSRSPDEMSLLEVVEAGEGTLIPETCTLGEGPCQWDEVCPLHETWGPATAALRKELAATSLAEIAQRSRAIIAGTYPIPTDAHRGMVVTMSVADSVQVELAASRVAAKLRSGGSWLAPQVEAASAEGEAIRVRVGPSGAAWLGKIVAVHLGEPEGTDEALVIPFAWEATGPTGLFPHLEGKLRLSAVDPERSELALTGRYRPPLGRAGQVLDETLLSRIASATVRSFLRRVARILEEIPEGWAPMQAVSADSADR
ncbi:MAG: Rrf2 family transcriptional regulator [Actinomycetota bacterium]|nr:MAG: Rrf2 family transcriptional regulator [Actinomycetota bacterium]